MNVHAGQSHDERVAARKGEKGAKGEKPRSLEQPGGEMAVEGTQADATHSCGELSEAGKEVWRTGAGIEKSGKSG